MHCLLRLLLAVALQAQEAPDRATLTGRPPESVPAGPLSDRGHESLRHGPPPGQYGPSGDNIRVSSPNPFNQNETVIRVNPTDRDHLIAGANDNRTGPYTCAFYSSSDGGLTWSEFLYVPTEFSSAGDPAAAMGPNGEVYFCALEFGSSSALYVGQSFDGGLTVPSWTRAVGSPTSFEDKEFLVADQTQGPLSGALYLTWTRFGFGNPIYVTSSFDQGLTWTAATRLSDSSNCQGSCPEVGPGGELYVAFIDFNTDTMQVDRSLDGGLTWGTDVTVGPVDCTLTNARFRHVCLPTIDVDRSGGPYHGSVYVAFTDYDNAAGSTDILCYRSTDGAQTFQGPVRVTDDTDQSSQFFPWLDVDENGNVNVGFYDRRFDNGNDNKIGFRVARSSDGGVSFQENHKVQTSKFDTTSYNDGTFIGDYTGLTSSDRTVHPVWTDGRNDTNDVFTARVQLDFFADVECISAATGGVAQLTLNPGPLYQNAGYRVAGSISGTMPGITFGSGVNLPLNYDLFFLFTLLNANGPVLQGFAGVLDAQGSASPVLDTLGPLDPGLAGFGFDLAAFVTLGGTVMWASNPTRLDIVP